MRKLIVALAVTAGLGSPAAASDDGKVQGIEDTQALGLSPGMRFVLSIDAREHATAAPDGVPALSDADKEVVKQLTDSYDDPEKLAQSTGANATMLGPGKAKAEPIENGVVRVSFFELPGRSGPEMLLVFENGYDAALRYKAGMMRGGKIEPTDVCTVLPHRRGYEHWPYPMDMIMLSAFTLVPYQEGSRPVCE